MKKTEDIWIEYHNKLSVFIRTRVAHDAAEDILQEVFVKIHSKIDSLKDDNKLEGWIYRITRNTVVDYYRSKRPMENLPDRLEQAQSEAGEMIRQALSSCLVPMIEQLSDQYRVAITLSEIEGKTQKDVAKLENISLSAAKSRVQRGRALLRSMLHDCCKIEFNQNNQLVAYEKKRRDCSYC